MNLAVGTDAASALFEGTTGDLMREGSTPASRARLVELMVEAQANLTIGDCGLDEMLNEMRSQMNRFIEENVAPHAHEWHCNNEYVPLEIIQKLAELGVFALTLPEEYDGMGLGKESMCLVSEELSRGWIAIGSLGTRPEIAAELILAGGTDEQKRSGCRRSHPARFCPPPFSPSPTPAPILPRCAPAPSRTATSTR
jgi:(2S)-methylsuccinyl-CoA dehydrogenase